MPWGSNGLMIELFRAAAFQANDKEGVEDNWNRLITPQFTSRLSPTSPFAAPTNCPLQHHFARWDAIFVKFNLWEFSLRS